MWALLKDVDGTSFRKCERPHPGPREVVVKVMCAGLCRTDVYLADGKLTTEHPRVLGHEGSGVICQLGEGVAQERLGERVAVFPWIGCGVCEICLDDPEHLGATCPKRRFLGRDLDGCFAEFMRVPVDRCVRLPDGIGFTAGAYLEPVMAALGVLKTPVRRAKRVGVLGTNRIARLTRIVLQEFGGCELIDAQAPSSYDLLIETDASERSLTTAFELLRPGGVLVVKSRPAESPVWPVRMQVEKEITSMGVGYGTVKMALLCLKTKQHLFQEIWSEPRSLNCWKEAFQKERQGEENRKVFFLPQDHACVE